MLELLNICKNTTIEYKNAKRINTLLFLYKKEKNLNYYLQITAYENQNNSINYSKYLLSTNCILKYPNNKIKLEGYENIKLKQYSDVHIYLPIISACLEFIDNEIYVHEQALFNKIYQIVCKFGCNYVIPANIMKKTPIKLTYLDFLSKKVYGNISKENILLAYNFCIQNEKQLSEIVPLHSHIENSNYFFKNDTSLKNGILLDW